MARAYARPPLGRFFGRSQNRLEVWWLFFTRDDGNFDLFKSCCFEPPLQVAFGETKPGIAVKFAGLFELMLQQVEDHDLPAAAKDLKGRVDGSSRRFRV